MSCKTLHHHHHQNHSKIIVSKKSHKKYDRQFDYHLTQLNCLFFDY